MSGEEGKPLWSGGGGPLGMGRRGATEVGLKMCHEAAREEGGEDLTEGVRVFRAENSGVEQI